MPKSEADILTEIFDSQRQLTKYYLSKLKEIDPLKTYTFDGVDLNSYYWIIGHLAWAEYFLIVRSCLNQKMDAPEWLKLFSIGSKISDSAELPPFKSVLDFFKLVHQYVLENAITLTDEQLAMKNYKALSFSGDDSVRAIFQHTIRHEGVHCGHLGLLCKINGIATV